MNILAAAEALYVNEMFDDYKPKKDPNGVTIEHALWMLKGICEGYVQYEKAHRWLGYAQAIIVTSGLCNLQYMKEINKKY